MTLFGATIFSAVALALAGGVQPAVLVEANPGAASALRAAGARPLAPALRIWQVSSTALPRLRHSGAVRYAEPNRVFATAADIGAGEPLVATEWWRSVVGVDSLIPPGPGKPVTIVDSGLDMTHEEFSSRPNTAVLNPQTISLDEDDHGTEVASVIGAPVNGKGLVGIYPLALLRSWDASPAGEITTAEAVHGIVAAANGGPGVINISWGGTIPDPLIRAAVLYAFRQGSLVVASSGNDGLLGNSESYPASFPHVLTVAATNHLGNVADFSSQSQFVDLAAPGAQIPVAEPLIDDPTGYIAASGTSFSAPMVAGAAAWVWTQRPELTNTQLFDVMRLSAHDIGPRGQDRATGFGMLDVPTALAYRAPASDPLEPNDEVDQISPAGLFAGGEPALTTPTRRTATLTARVDRYEDPRDVYRVFIPAHGTLVARTSAGSVDLLLFAAGAGNVRGNPAAKSLNPGLTPERAVLRNPLARGVYAYVDVRPDRETIRTSYVLSVKTSARR